MIETIAGNENEFHVGKLVDSFYTLYCLALVGSLLYLPYWKRGVKEKKVIKEVFKTVENLKMWVI